MRLTIIFIRLIIIVCLSAFLQASVAAQTVSFSGKSVSLKDVLAVLKTQTGNVFFYDVSILKDAKPVTVHWKKITLEEALNDLFKNQPLTWVMEDKTISIIKKPGEIANDEAVSIPAIRSSIPVISGVVTDEEGLPIDYASVSAKGVKKGMFTDHRGAYSIQANKNDVLIFSSVGYKAREIKVTATVMNIKLQQEVKPLESLLVGGNLNAVKRKADATTVTILDAKKLEKIPLNTLDQIFTGWVAGTSSYNIGDATEGFPAVSIRGAGGPTSLAAIAVYIDGMEYAGGSGYLSLLDKNNIDRIEIVRGPGAATLYGTGSNGGIIQIFTKKAKMGESRMSITSSAGFIKSKWVDKDPLQQMHNLEMATGFGKLALTLGGSYRTAGAYLPDGGQKNKAFYSGAKFNLGKLQANFILRYYDGNYTISRSPVFDTATHPRTDIIIEPSPGFTIPAYEWFLVKPTASIHKKGQTETFIGGANISHQTTSNWVNKLEAGYTSNSSIELPLPDGGTPLQRQYVSDKKNVTTVRYYNVINLSNNGNGFAAAVTSGAEYKKYASAITFNRATAAASQISREPDNENYGAFVQVNPSYKNVYLTMGLRYEKNKLFNAAWNPGLGLTTNFDLRSATLKPRISWGKGITAPSYENRFGSPPGVFSVIYGNPDIGPQSQQGFDYGLELFDKKNNRYKFEAVYYDNILKDMMSEQEMGRDLADTMLIAFKWINIAKISNKGWEFSGEYRINHFNLQATFSIINTTLKDSTGSYTLNQLKLAPGTRLVNLPKHVAGINLTYYFQKLSSKMGNGFVSINVTELDGVKTNDDLNYALDVSYGRTPYIPGKVGNPVEISPVFRVGLYADLHVTNDLRFFTQGYNILNDYKYIYNPRAVSNGAAWLFGLKYNITTTGNKQTAGK